MIFTFLFGLSMDYEVFILSRMREEYDATGNTDIKLLATAVGAAILLDATIVRALLVPALVTLLGRYNWYLPNWMAKVLRVPPSPLPAPESHANSSAWATPATKGVPNAQVDA
jgi:RND superfamily putative drug exporter